MKRPALPIGTSDFLKLRRAGKYYVDKSGFVTDVLRSSAEVLLLPRPRRFGKTLNISTLQAFVERTDDAERASRAALFEDLAIWQAGEDVRRPPGLAVVCEDEAAEAIIHGMFDDLAPRLGLLQGDVEIGRDTGKDRYPHVQVA